MTPQTLIAMLLATQATLYGDDWITRVARQLGYEERVLPCSTEEGRVKVAIRATGEVLYNDEQKPAADVAERIHADRLHIYGICLYVEGPMSNAANSAFQQIWAAAAKNNIGVARYTDSEFTKVVVPKVPIPPSQK